jgi:hypothetical protein
MAALGCFIARSGEKALSFFKLMKRTGKFEWTPEADKAFAELKRGSSRGRSCFTSRPSRGATHGIFTDRAALSE